jgi:hypothetical protein
MIIHSIQFKEVGAERENGISSKFGEKEVCKN